MLTGFGWLALEVLYLDRARAFYETHLDLAAVDESAHQVVFDVGGDLLVLREPGAVPRGGLHTHFALATPPDRYAAWYDALDDEFDLVEYDFGGSKSLYFFDPDGHCVEIGQRGRGDDPLDGVFEVVLEVESLDRAEAFYRALGFDPYDRGSDRRRVRLDGPVELELWEPQRGLADARGGVHVDMGLLADDPASLVEPVAEEVRSVEEVAGGVRVQDPDGHYLTFAGAADAVR
ncbi:VOC family protein [Halobacteriaceae archaeon GCM10025711]